MEYNLNIKFYKAALFTNIWFQFFPFAKNAEFSVKNNFDITAENG